MRSEKIETDSMYVSFKNCLKLAKGFIEDTTTRSFPENNIHIILKGL